MECATTPESTLQQPNENRVYLGNLPYEAREEDLRSFFADRGFPAEEVRVITDRETGRSRGFGFAAFASPDVTQDVISTLDGEDFQGRRLRVSPATPREPRSNGDHRQRTNRQPSDPWREERRQKHQRSRNGGRRRDRDQRGW